VREHYTRWKCCSRQCNAEVVDLSSERHSFDIDQIIRNLPASPAFGDRFDGSLMNFNGIDAALADAAARVAKLSDPPPRPPTFRGAIGALLVRVVRRMLFWHTPKILDSQQAILAVFASLRSPLQQLSIHLDQVHDELEEERVKSQRSREALAALQRQVGSSDIDVIQRRTFERMDRVEADLSRISVRADLLPNLYADIEALSQTVAEVQRRVGEGSQALAALATQLQAADSNTARLREEFAAVSHGLTRFERISSALEQALTEQTTRSDSLAQNLAVGLARIAQAETLAKESYLFSHAIKKDVTLLGHRLTQVLRRARKDSVECATDTTVPNPLDSKDDALYVTFEDVFRGTREDIKGRQGVYLNRLTDLPGGRPVLDLGCGRGEWLELLREHSIPARGVDRNATMVATCREFGLDAELDDAIHCLRKLPDGSMGAVTSFHMVEHLPFSIVLELLDEALRVLSSDGVLILETPNPDNLLVASQTFYTDPTHVRPLPSSMMRFIVEQKGFCFPEVVNLHPYPQAYRFSEHDSEIAKRLNEYFYGPQDYGIVAFKP